MSEKKCKKRTTIKLFTFLHLKISFDNRGTAFTVFLVIKIK